MNRDTEWLTQLPLSFELRKGRMTVSLAFGDGEPIVVKTQDESGENRRFEKELTAHARSLKVPFREKVAVETIIAEFLKDTDHAAGKEK